MRDKLPTSSNMQSATVQKEAAKYINWIPYNAPYVVCERNQMLLTIAPFIIFFCRNDRISII